MNSLSICKPRRRWTLTRRGYCDSILGGFHHEILRDIIFNGLAELCLHKSIEWSDERRAISTNIQHCEKILSAFILVGTIGH